MRSRGWLSPVQAVSVEGALGNAVDEVRERAHAGTVGVRIEPRLVQQHPAKAGRSRAYDVDVVEITDMDGRLAPRAAALERNL